MSIGRLARPPQDLTSFLGRKWLESISVQSNDLNNVLDISFLLLSADSRLPNARHLASSADITYSDGGAGGTISFGLSPTGVTPGSYNQVTVDAYGRITSGSSISYIKTDGTSITTASIPFAEGLQITGEKYVYFGAGVQTYIRATTGNNSLQFSAQDTNYKNLYFDAAFNGKLRFTGGGSTAVYDATGAVFTLPNVPSSFSIQTNIGDSLFDVSYAGSRNTSYQSTFVNVTNANAFVVENLAGTDVFRVNTTTPGVTIYTYTGILKGTAGLVSVATAGTDYENPLTFNPPLSRVANAVSFTVPGSDTQFFYNNAGTIAGSSFFTLAADNTPTIGDGNAQITSIGAATISNASPAVVTKAAHGLAINDRVIFTSTGNVPLPLHPDSTTDGVQEYYYIISAGFGVNSFQISLTRGGAAINTTTAGSGTHTLFKYVGYQLNIDSANDCLLEWRKDPLYNIYTYSVRNSTDTYFNYPNYAGRFQVNTTQLVDYESPVAAAFWINAGINCSELYGFWGGCYDTGGSAKNVTGQAVGALFYNYFVGTNARTISTIVGGQFTSEVNSNVTSTNIIGGDFTAVVAGTPTVTNAIAARVNDSTCAATNNYGLRVGVFTSGTNNYPVFFNTTAKCHFRAAGQYIYSSAASTIDADTTTTGNLRVGGTIEYTWNATTFTFADANNIAVGTTTGTIIGTATTQKLGFYNATPITQRSGAAQAAVATTASTNITPFGYTTAAQADAIVTLVNELRAWAVAQGFIKGSA